MIVIRNLPDLLNKIRQKNAQIILIDGGDGSGKSTLAKEIAQSINAVHINFDDYLEKNRGNFLDFIKYDHLKKKIEDSRPPIIIEGVCALSVINKLQHKFDLHIYVKRMSNFGFWPNDNLYDVDENVEDFIAEKNEEHRKFCKTMAQIEEEEYDPEDTTIPKLTEELIRYHYEFKPQETADIVYERLS